MTNCEVNVIGIILIKVSFWLERNYLSSIDKNIHRLPYLQH